MSTNNSLAVIEVIKDTGQTVKSPPAVLAQAQTNAQNTVATVAEVAGKGGFTADATVGQLLEFQFTGLLVVFVVLGAITIVSSLISRILKIVAPDQYHVRPKIPQ